MGILKLDARVRRCGLIPGKASEKPVPSVANVASAPLETDVRRIGRSGTEYTTYIPMMPTHSLFSIEMA